MDFKGLYRCKYCGHQTVKLNENEMITTIYKALLANLMGYNSYSTAVYVFKGICEKCDATQHLMLCPNAVTVESHV